MRLTITNSGVVLLMSQNRMEASAPAVTIRFSVMNLVQKTVSECPRNTV